MSDEKDEPVFRDEEGDPADEKFKWAVESKILGKAVTGIRSCAGDQIDGKPCVSVTLSLELGVDLVIAATNATQLDIIIQSPSQTATASKMVN